jgi:hypothetical protein
MQVRSSKGFLLGALAASGLALMVASCSTGSGSLPDGPLKPCDRERSDRELRSVGPGGLIDALDITGIYSDDDAFPDGARAWRVQYVSTSVDESDLVAVCGIVVAPDAGAKLARDAAGTGRMFSWAHGTIGLEARCMPSVDPNAGVWGEMPGGIGAIAWGSKVLGNHHEGAPGNGQLQWLIDGGWVVSLTDYEAGDAKNLMPYVVGKVEGANVLDAARAASQLIDDTYRHDRIPAYDMILSGHSQGGHAALFAGQLADKYLSATSPERPVANFEIVGIAVGAPASNLIAQPDKQQGVNFGDGLADSELHLTFNPLVFDLKPLGIQIGPVLLSYLLASWTQLSEQKVPGDGAKFPAYPPGQAPLDMRALATAQGEATAGEVAPLCPQRQALKVKDATSKYRDAKKYQGLIPPAWNLPDDYVVGEYFKGGIDKLCATTETASIVAWCDWVRYNLPGPLGTNPFDKVAAHDGVPVPVLISQGTNDQVVYCVNPEGHSDLEVTPPSDCMSRALYDTLAAEAYCPGGTAQGHLQLDLWRRIKFQDPSGHLEIAGQAASFSQKKRPSSELRFAGSRTENFISHALARDLEPGCTAAVVNQNKQ